jgi:hypothetical protein
MVALVVLRNKAIKPLLAAAQNLCPSRGAQNPRPLDKHYGTIRKAMQAVFQKWDLLPEHRQLFFKISQAPKGRGLHLADHTYEALEVIHAAEALAERSEERPAQPVTAYPNG